MNGDARHFIERGDHLFGQRGTLMSLWQEIAENFYPERADFTVSRSLGDDFAAHLTTSYPVLVRRDLGSSFSSMMRPTNIQWFHMKPEHLDDAPDQAAREWLERSTTIQKRAMYDRRSLFVRASKEGDHDTVSFGQCVKTVEMNRNADGLLFRCWHLRDVAWAENAEGKIDEAHRKWKPTASELVDLFGAKCHEKVKEKLAGPNRKPFEKVNVRHVVVPSHRCNGLDYRGKARGLPYVEMFIDQDNEHIIEITGQNYFKYIIPRWQTVSGSQYSFSPATIVALPDARLLQAMTSTLLEAGEKATNPPMIAVQEAVRSDISIYAGGITWVDSAYDERLGEVLRPLSQDSRGIPLGIEMQRDTMAMLREAFYINRLTLPTSQGDMTAYEVGQRVQEYIRQASPLFEPLEDEDNAAVCDVTFDILMRNGAFGPHEDIPQSLRGKDITFRFESPLHEAVERQKGQKFMEAKALVTDTLALDETADTNLDVREALRDCLNSIGTPASWIRGEREAQTLGQERKDRMQTQEMLSNIQQGAEAAEQIGMAGQAMQPMSGAA